MLRVVLAVTLLCVYVVEGRHYLLRWSTNDDVSLQKFDLGDHFLNPDNGALEVIANEDQMTQLKVGAFFFFTHIQKVPRPSQKQVCDPTRKTKKNHPTQTL